MSRQELAPRPALTENGFYVIYALSYVAPVREVPAGWRGETGEAAAVVDKLVHSVDRLVVYVCGGGNTVNAVRDALVKKGMDRKSVKWKKFW